MVRVRFFDDETLEGTAQDLDLNEPDFILEIDDPSGLENSEVAWIPLSAVKMIELPIDKKLEAKGRKVAIRFLDGEVLRAHLAGEIKRHRYGLAMHLHPETAGAPRRLAVPFSAIKALFYIREFDGRDEEDHGLPSEAYLARRTMAPLLDVLEEMDALSRLHRGGLLSDAEYQSKRSQLLEVL
jgi:hypothetical protein